jgi:mono/diheme cytochrome c family protein
MCKIVLVLALGLAAGGRAAAQHGPWGLGRTATAADIDKDAGLVGPTGEGLPVGHGTTSQGRLVYAQRCAQCHGPSGEGNAVYPAVVGGRGTLGSPHPLLTVGSYWPFATTVWDYVNRAMPYLNPGTLQPDEVYAVTAYLLAMNKIIPEDMELNERNLAGVKMPNRNGFIPDPRPDVK